jgi:predicted nucleotidyltransferase
VSAIRESARLADFKRASAARTLAQGSDAEVPIPSDRTGPSAKHSVELRMDREQVIAELRAHEAELRSRGVAHVALFGSLARGEAGPDSDIDIMVDIEPEAPVGVFEYVAIMQFLEDLFPVKVDVANRRTLKPLVRPNVERDAVFAF